jgi:predicted lipoprotein with Yx(FWY)xxD motif
MIVIPPRSAIRTTVLLGAVAMVAAACGEAGVAPSSASNSSGAGTKATTASTPDIAIGNSSLGQVLTDRSGLTLYYFKPEQGSKLVCDSGSCVATWPLVTASGTPSAGQGVSGQLTTVSAPNGQTEVAYNGWPLHTYAGDKSPGDTNGQGIGGQWFAATPSLTSSGAGGSAAASPSASATYNPY